MLFFLSFFSTAEIARTPEQVIANERKKESDALAKIATIELSLKGLK